MRPKRVDPNIAPSKERVDQPKADNGLTAAFGLRALKSRHEILMDEAHVDSLNQVATRRDRTGLMGKRIFWNCSKAVV